jgi:toxin secretion/phage lysis holin
MLLFVVVAVQADRLLGADYVRDTVCIGFCVNEMISIVENLGHAGVPLPQAVTKALEQLSSKNQQ